MCGHRWGLHITATTAIPEAVRTGRALSFGKRIFFLSFGTAAMMSTKRGSAARPYLAVILVFSLLTITSTPLSCAFSSSCMISPITMTVRSSFDKPTAERQKIHNKLLKTKWFSHQEAFFSSFLGFFHEIEVERVCFIYFFLWRFVCLSHLEVQKPFIFITFFLIFLNR